MGFEENPFFKIIQKATGFYFDEPYPPDYLKESWTELVRHTIQFPSIQKESYY